MPERRRPRLVRIRRAGGRTSRASTAPASPRSAGRRAIPHAGLLAVDVGNSETTLGLFRDRELAAFWRLTSVRMTADEIVGQVTSLFASRDGSIPIAPRAAVLSSVVPTISPAWTEALGRITGEPPLEVNARTAETLPIRYHDRWAVGADRIANGIAVRALYGTPAIVVDLGTATTFDCISKQGAYLGGIIAPGVGTSSEELFRRAARL
jgi:type III pantothenate kinase